MEKLATKFKNDIVKRFLKENDFKSPFAMPLIEKVVVSSGIGDYKTDDKMVAKIAGDLAIITGQKPKINYSRKAVSAFKLREGQPVGLTVTLRKEKMFDFLDRLINVALPRLRDFHGLLNKSFDGKGNYTIAIKDHAIFPEVKFEDIEVNFGFQINIKTTAKNDEDSKKLLALVGIPFEKENQEKK